MLVETTFDTGEALLNKVFYLRHLDPDVLTDRADSAEDVEAYQNATQGYNEGLLREVSPAPSSYSKGTWRRGLSCPTPRSSTH